MAAKKKENRADALIYHALKKAIEEDKLRIYLDYGKINRPSSPVYNPWESLLPVLIPTLIGLLLITMVSVLFGLLFIVGMVLIYAHVVKKRLFKKLIARTKDYLTSGYEHCCDLWEFGGIVLVNAENKKVGCVAPEGDWKEFVVQNYADLMVEKAKDKNEADDDTAKQDENKEAAGNETTDAKH